MIFNIEIKYWQDIYLHEDVIIAKITSVLCKIRFILNFSTIGKWKNIFSLIHISTLKGKGFLRRDC